MFYKLFVYFYYFIFLFFIFYNKQNNLNSGSIQLYSLINLFIWLVLLFFIWLNFALFYYKHKACSDLTSVQVFCFYYLFYVCLFIIFCTTHWSIHCGFESTSEITLFYLFVYIALCFTILLNFI